MGKPAGTFVVYIYLPGYALVISHLFCRDWLAVVTAIPISLRYCPVSVCGGR